MVLCAIIPFRRNSWLWYSVACTVIGTTPDFLCSRRLPGCRISVRAPICHNMLAPCSIVAWKVPTEFCSVAFCRAVVVPVFDSAWFCYEQRSYRCFTCMKPLAGGDEPIIWRFTLRRAGTNSITSWSWKYASFHLLVKSMCARSSFRCYYVKVLPRLTLFCWFA